MADILFLGIDGGGSKTTAVVFDGSGCFVCSFIGESINYYSIGMKAARENMLAIINGLESLCGVHRYKGAVIGMSALNSRADEKELVDFAGGIIDAENLIMDSDLYIALEALNSPGECAVVISGTGSMAAARTAEGEIIHAGGFGHILGDEGSGYQLALAGIKAAIAAAECYGPDTVLLDDCLEFFKIENVYELIDLFYEKGISRKSTAAFAQKVHTRAAQGDEAALEIVKSGARQLAATALSVLKRLSPAAPIGLWGGIFQHSVLFRELFTEELCRRGYSSVSLLLLPPETGAVIAALGISGTEVSEKTVDNIIKTYVEKDV